MLTIACGYLALLKDKNRSSFSMWFKFTDRATFNDRISTLPIGNPLADTDFALPPVY
jgi:hypothetical protein